LLYYNSELQDLFDLYTTAKRDIKSWIFTGNWKGEEILLTDVETLFSTQYQQSILEYLTSSVVHRLPSSLVAYYQQEKAKRYATLMNE
jgi:hypothetical protein